MLANDTIEFDYGCGQLFSLKCDAMLKKQSLVRNPKAFAQDKKNKNKNKKLLYGGVFKFRMSGSLYRTERLPGSPFQSKGLDGTPRPGGVQ